MSKWNLDPIKKRERERRYNESHRKQIRERNNKYSTGDKIGTGQVENFR